MQELKIPKWQQRVFVFEAIYGNLIDNDLGVKNISTFDVWGDFEKNIFDNYLQNKNKYLEEISFLLKEDWTIERLNLPLLAILLEAISEHHSLNTEYQVLIQQSIVTSKKYCDENEYKFLNALLDNYLKKNSNLDKEDKENKKW